MNYDMQDPHSFYDDHDTKTMLMCRMTDVGIVAAAADPVVGDCVFVVVFDDDGGGGGVAAAAADDDAVGGGVVVDVIALKSLRNYVYYNYCPRKYHQRQGVVSNCKMALCLAIIVMRKYMKLDLTLIR